MPKSSKGKRMLSWRGIVAALALNLVASTANADWQYTKWGMSKEEVVRASAGAAIISPTPCNKTAPEKGEPFYVTTIYSTGNFTFDGCLTGSSTVGLRQATFLLKDANADSSARLFAALGAKYGKEVSKGNLVLGPSLIATTEWHDEKTKIVLSVYINDSGAYSTGVTYTPLVDESKGL